MENVPLPKKTNDHLILSFCFQCLENVWDLFPCGFLWLPLWRPGWTRVCLQGAINHQISRDLPQTWGMLTGHDANKGAISDLWETYFLKKNLLWCTGVLHREVWWWYGWNYQGLQPSGQKQTGSQQGNMIRMYSMWLTIYQHRLQTV